MPSIVDQFESQEIGIFNRNGRKERKGKTVFIAENAEIAEKNGFLIQITKVIFPLRPQRSLR